MSKNNSAQIIQNVKQLYDKYGEHIKSDNHLVILYWNKINQINMSDKKFSVTEWIEKSIPSEQIINAKYIIDELKRSEIKCHEKEKQ